MEEEHISVGTFISVIEDRYKIPDNVFLRARFYNQLITVLNEVVKYYGVEYEAALSTAKKLESDTFCVREHKKTVSSVDIDMLRETNPSVFEKVVKIKAFDVVKILSREFIYDSCKNKLGSEDIKKFETINKTDLREVVGNKNAEIYFKTSEKSVGWFVDYKSEITQD